MLVKSVYLFRMFPVSVDAKKDRGALKKISSTSEKKVKRVHEHYCRLQQDCMEMSDRSRHDVEKHNPSLSDSI